ncbi:protocadherin Fat 4-like Cad96Ca [Arctopsyche grandis]|uniref:protocadherin Fat 4-like Cad96Ca n=1 Tax=Arctopsyche grandis TaxID=121162 RepID=UPI00406D965B
MITARPIVMALDFREYHSLLSFSLKIFILLVFTKALRVQGVQDSRCYLESGGSVESFFVSEDLAVGSIVGVLGIHGDPHEQIGNIALSLKEIDSPVRIAPGSKNLTLARPLDKEGVLGPSSVYVNVICDRKRTSDPGFEIPVSIRVTDANDNAPVWVNAPYRLRVAELTAPGSRALHAAKATDRDQLGPFSTVEYKVLPGPYQDYFTFENSLEGTLVLRKALDFETLPNFTIGLRAQDQGNPPNFSDTVLYVEVLDSDDQNPKFLDDGYTAILPDRASQGSQVMISPKEISAIDQDTGINAALFYTFNIDHPSFNIDKESARVSVAREILDDDLLMPVTLVVRATQYDNPDRYALATLTISKQSVARKPVHFSQKNYYATVLENLPINSVLMTLNTNRLRDRALKYFVSDRKFLTKFAINTAGEVVLRKNLDYEVDDKYTFQVMVTDGLANDTATINITVLNVNDWDPRFRYPQYEFFVNPNLDEAANGLPILIGKVEAADGDRGDVVMLTLRGADASLFYITDQGEIFLRENALSLVNSSIVHVVAMATDTGAPPRQTSVPLIVHFSEALMSVTNAATFSGNSMLLIIIFGTILGLLGIVIVILIGYIYKVKRPKSGGNKVGTGFVQHEKLPPPHNVAGAGTGLHAPGSNHSTSNNLAALTGALGAASGSLLSVSAGASTILANSSSSLNVNGQDADHNGGAFSDGNSHPNTLPRGIMARASQRFPHRGGVSPGPGMAIGGGGAGVGALPPGGPQAALMSNHLTTAGGGRSGVAWPAATIPARVKKLSWDDDDPKIENGGLDIADPNNPNSSEHLNLTVYF